MTDTYGFAPTEKMLSPTSLAEMLDISDRHLTNLRREDATFPAPVMLGKLPRWSPASIRRWMERDLTSCASCLRDEQVPSGRTSMAQVAPSGKKSKVGKRVQRVF